MPPSGVLKVAVCARLGLPLPHPRRQLAELPAALSLLGTRLARSSILRGRPGADARAPVVVKTGRPLWSRHLGRTAPRARAPCPQGEAPRCPFCVQAIRGFAVPCDGSDGSDGMGLMGVMWAAEAQQGVLADGPGAGVK
jgi:hypothetical protein